MEAIKNFIGGWGLGGVSQEEERDYSSTSLKIVPSQQEQHKSLNERRDECYAKCKELVASMTKENNIRLFPDMLKKTSSTEVIKCNRVVYGK